MSIAAIVPGEGLASLTRLVTALRDGGVNRIVVVAPPRATPGATRLIHDSLAIGVEVVSARKALPNLRTTVEIGLAHLARPGQRPPSSLLLASADPICLTSVLVARLGAAGAASPGSIVVPMQGGRRGYPVLIPWNLAIWLPSIPRRAGVNELISAHGDSVVELPCDGPDDTVVLAAVSVSRRWAWPT